MVNDGVGIRTPKSVDEQKQIERKLLRLSLLFEISQTLERSLDLNEVIQPVLKLVAEQAGMLRGTITLLNRETREIFIDEAYGLSVSQKQKGRYNLGEGITGKVVQTGKPAIIPRIAEEPLFLDRTGARKKLDTRDISFICVPIKIGQETIGALSFDRLFAGNVPLEEDTKLLSIIASMIAQAVRLRQAAQEERRRLMAENVRLREELKLRFRPSNIIGNSSEMQGVYNLIAQVSNADTTVLIRGESGTGKELVAHAIHYNSSRANKPFIKVHCAALPESIIESELFGHEKGAFTGAIASRKGRFELAHSGTIFLDEIGDLSASTQIKILRVLQEKEIERVGGVNTIKTDVRIIAATNRNLEEAMLKAEFREDLYYRLNVFPIHIPPLRDRKSDILLLADFFVEKYGKTNHKDIRRISTSAIDMLMAYHWPGNVRELENSIERAVLLSTDEVIHGYHLPPTLQTAEASNTVQRGKLSTTLDNLEREMVIEAIKSSRGNMSKAASMLGLTERKIGLRVKKHGIDAAKFKVQSKYL
ncbi:MAG TPA: sigma 54-interacting transcriptional regulator [Spirochaetia bacterium]|nr:sigma 54-interacting transcriptional regulator [Spirochaetia bacterium]